MFIVILLLATCCRQTATQMQPRGRLRIPNAESTLRAANNINLPNGFHPHIAPYRSIPYPHDGSTTTQRIHIPFLRESQPATDIEQPAEPVETPNAYQNAMEPGHVKESIVYGHWKPEHPIKPNHIEGESAEEQEDIARLGAMLMGLTTTLESQRKSDSFEQYQSKQLGRRKIPMRDPGTATETVHGIKFSNMEPMLPSISKQINESSIEETTANRRIDALPTENTWIPILYTTTEITSPVTTKTKTTTTTTSTTKSTTEIQTTTTTTTDNPTNIIFNETTLTSLKWPTDFLESTTTASSASSTTTNSDGPANDYKAYQDVLNSAQMHSELSIVESLAPQLSLNISHVGVPYEERNSQDESIICVPLTVMETTEMPNKAESNETMEVERVYCFPLPKVDEQNVRDSNEKIEMVNENLPKSQNISIRQDIKLAASKATQLNGIGLCSILYIIWHTSLTLI